MIMSKVRIYTNQDNQTSIEVQFDKNTLWLNQKQIADVFETRVPAINKHIKNIIKEGEMKAAATISILETVQLEGKRKIAQCRSAFIMPTLCFNKTINDLGFNLIQTCDLVYKLRPAPG